jgi:uncharacterized membrane protein YccC
MNATTPPEQPPPTPPQQPATLPWVPPAQDEIPQMHADVQRRRRFAAAQSGLVEPVPLAVLAEAQQRSPGSERTELTASDVQAGAPSLETVPEFSVSDTVSADAIKQIERRLSKRAVDYRDVARALSAAVRDQLAELQRQKPNEEDRLPFYNDLVAFLQKLGNELAALADALDQAAKSEPPEPIFLGNAAKIARQLELGFMEWLERDRVHIFRIGFGTATLCAVGHFIGGLSPDAIDLLKILFGKK